VRFATAKPRTVRVLLANALPEARVWSPRRWRLLGLRPDGRNVTPLKTGATYMVQARADGTLAPEAEAALIERLLTHWALRTTLDTSAGCGAHQHRLSTLEGA
jgi:hypothetical protein